jgi:hypothetical protein
MLKLDDKVEFIYPEGYIMGVVMERYIEFTEATNYKIFNVLSVDKESFCRKYYEYEPEGGSWPQYREGDFEALYRVLSGLVKEFPTVSIKVNGISITPYKSDSVHYASDSVSRVEKLYEFEYSKDELVGIINSKKKTMTNLFEKAATMLMSEPAKTFKKAGITSSDGEQVFTDQGQELFLQFLLNKFGDEFKKEIVDKIIAEDKKDSKKSYEQRLA